jgi:hypothetical protein
MEVFWVQAFQGAFDVCPHLQDLLAYDLPRCEWKQIVRANTQVSGNRGARLRDAQRQKRQTTRIAGRGTKAQAVAKSGAEFGIRFLVAVQPANREEAEWPHGLRPRLAR